MGPFVPRLILRSPLFRRREADGARWLGRGAGGIDESTRNVPGRCSSQRLLSDLGSARGGEEAVARRDWLAPGRDCRGHWRAERVIGCRAVPSIRLGGKRRDRGPRWSGTMQGAPSRFPVPPSSVVLSCACSALSGAAPCILCLYFRYCTITTAPSLQWPASYSIPPLPRPLLYLLPTVVHFSQLLTVSASRIHTRYHLHYRQQHRAIQSNCFHSRRGPNRTYDGIITTAYPECTRYPEDILPSVSESNSDSEG